MATFFNEQRPQTANAPSSDDLDRHTDLARSAIKYDEMLELALIICKRARRDSNFLLIDCKADIVGCMSIDLSDLSDHDLACDQDGETSWCAS